MATSIEVVGRKITLYESSELDGITGDHGETFCLFLRDLARPLDGGWLWFHTRDEALAYMDTAMAYIP